MIVEYLRPESIEEALVLMSRQAPRTVPLGGGIKLSKNNGQEIAVVDLQRLSLNKIEKVGNILDIGATVTLQQLFENESTPLVIKETIQREMNFNLRQMATVAGTIICANGLSSLVCVLLAYGTKLQVEPGGDFIDLENFYAERRRVFGKLITKLIINTEQMVKFSAIGRSPLEAPIVCVAVNLLSNNRVRVVRSTNGPVPDVDVCGRKGEELVSNSYSQLITNNFQPTIQNTLIKRLLGSIV